MIDPAQLAAAALSRGAMQKPEELAAFVEFVAGRKLSTVVEIGTARGGTFYVWCRLAEPGATIISIDLPDGPFGPAEGLEEISVLSSFADASQSVHFLRMNSRSPWTRSELELLLAGRAIDLLYIDGDHTYQGVRTDFLRYAPLVHQGGLVVFHDILPTPIGPEVQVYRLWQQLREIGPDHCHEVVRVDPGSLWGGFGVLIWPGSDVFWSRLKVRSPLRGRASDAVEHHEHTSQFPRQADDLEIDEISDGFVVYQPSGGGVHYLNRSAAVVLVLCTGSNSLDQISQTVQEAFGLAKAPDGEIEAVLSQLHAEGLVV